MKYKILLLMLLPALAIGQPVPVTIPGGSDEAVQYNDNYVFGGDPNFTFDDVNDIFTVNNNSIGNNSVSFQPGTDSTTFFQILDADGGTPVFNVDTTNEWVGIGTDSPHAELTFSNSPALICSDTSDGSDNKSIFIAGGGAADYTRGAFIRLYGNETNNGSFYMAAGNATSANFEFYVSSEQMLRIDKWGFSINDAGQPNDFTIEGDTDSSLFSIDGSEDKIGISELYPETLIEMTNAAPYITSHNETHEDTDGGRESRFVAFGEQSGGEETTLGYDEWSHSGSSDDEKGQKRLYINDGDDGDSPTQVGEWDSIGLEFVDSTIIYDVNNISADITTFQTYGLHIIDSSGAGITGTLAAGTKTGQSVKFVCKTAGNDIDITVSNHVTSDPEVIRLDTAKEWFELVWDGTDWVEVDGNGQTYP